jgi:hypothetical protein
MKHLCTDRFGAKTFLGSLTLMMSPFEGTIGGFSDGRL